MRVVATQTPPLPRRERVGVRVTAVYRLVMVQKPYGKITFLVGTSSNSGFITRTFNSGGR